MADPVPARLLTALDLAAFVREPDGRFRPVGGAPRWLGGWLCLHEDGRVSPADDSHFLSDFLPMADAFWDAGEAGRLMSGAFTEAGADGVERTLEATAISADDERWLLLGLPLMTYATTQRLLQTARDETLDVERTRRRHGDREILLHTIVHDLSNPLAGLHGSLRLLDDGALPGEDRELVAIARRQAQKMQAMIRDVLRIFRDEVDAMVPATASPPNGAEVVRQAAEALAPRARLAGVALDVDVPDGLPVIADASRLERAVMNLVENAIRHSPEGGTVRLGAHVDGREVVLTVEDEGPGVAPEHTGDLFERFRPRGRSQGQVGLGLYMCRLAAESWGGSVGHEPRENGGARFWMRLKRPRKRLSP